MRYINEDTLGKYAEEFQRLFEKHKVEKVKVDCTPSTPGDKSVTFFIEPAENAHNLEKDIKKLCGTKNLFLILYVHGFGINGKEWNRSKNAIDFNELLKGVRASSNSVIPIVIEGNNKPNLKVDGMSELVKEKSEEVVRKVLVVENVDKIESPEHISKPSRVSSEEVTDYNLY